MPEMIWAKLKGLVSSRKKTFLGALTALFLVLSILTTSLALPRPAGAATVPVTTPTTQTCQGGAMGWIICPIASGIQTATDAFYNKIIIPFLSIPPLTQSVDDPVYSVWNNIRDVANIAFVLAFLIIIYSQATSMGIGNYGIKRLLPKLILVAVLTNVSYFICAALVDIFNIIGSGTASLMLSALPSHGNTSIYVSNGSGLAVLAAGAAGLTALIASSGGLLPALFLFIAIGFLAIVAAVIVLVIRQIAVITLVMIAPLAFVAWLLPNTEKWFSKWYTTFGKLLIMYPMIIAVFVGAKIFSAIITQTAFIQDDAIKGAIGFLVQAVPLFALPFTFAVAGGAFHKIAGAVMTRGSKLGRDWGDEGFKRSALGRNHEMRKAAKDTAKQHAFLEAAASGKGVRGRMLKVRNSVPAITPAGRQASKDYVEKLQAAKQKMQDERTNTMKTAVTREAGLNYAPLVGQMRKSEAVQDFARRYRARTGIQLGTGEIEALTDLKKRFGSQVGTREFSRAALLASHDMGSDTRHIKAATDHYARQLAEEVQHGHITRSDMGNELAGVIGQSAKAGGIMALSGTGIDPASGNYHQFGVKSPERIVATTDFSNYESGQFGDLRAAIDPVTSRIDPSRMTDDTYALARAVLADLYSSNEAVKQAMIRRVAEARGKKAFSDLATLVDYTGAANAQSLRDMIAGFK